MQNQPSHWRKQWPEGSTDAGQGDEDILSKFQVPESRKDKFKHRVPHTSVTTYPYHFDHDVIETHKSIKTAEKKLGKKFSDKGARKKGLDMLWEMSNPLGERSDPLGEVTRDVRNQEGKLLHIKHKKH